MKSFVFQRQGVSEQNPKVTWDDAKYWGTDASLSNSCEYFEGMQVVFDFKFTTNSSDAPDPKDIEICFSEY